MRERLAEVESRISLAEDLLEELNLTASRQQQTNCEKPTSSRNLLS